jgi:hypothetical protein
VQFTYEAIFEQMHGFGNRKLQIGGSNNETVQDIFLFASKASASIWGEHLFADRATMFISDPDLMLATFAKPKTFFFAGNAMDWK